MSFPLWAHEDDDDEDYVLPDDEDDDDDIDAQMEADELIEALTEDASAAAAGATPTGTPAQPASMGTLQRMSPPSTGYLLLERTAISRPSFPIVSLSGVSALRLCSAS